MVMATVISRIPCAVPRKLLALVLANMNFVDLMDVVLKRDALLCTE